MTLIDRAAGLALAFALSLGIAWTSHARLAPHEPGAALLRLSWTARPERVETCRAPSAQEQANLPAHMRQPVICEGTSAAYRLEVWRDGVRVFQEIVQGGGLRHDRPLYVFREIPQPVGDAAITVRFERAEASVPAAAGGERAPNAALISDVASSLVLERRLRFTAGRVTLVSYDPDLRDLVLVTPPEER